MKKILIPALVLGAVFTSNQAAAQTDTSGRAPVYRATETKKTELKHTKLKVSFDYQKEQMAGEEWLTAAPYFYSTDSLQLDAKGMLIHEVAMDKNGSRTPLKYTYADNKLNIFLGRKFERNMDYTVYIRYTARPNEVKQQGSAAITDAKGLYFIDPREADPEKPTQIWTQGETESSSAWFPTIDNPAQKTTQEIYMTVPDKYVTLSNGLLKSSQKEGNGLRTDYWVMDKKHSPYLFFMGVGDYAVVKDKWRNISVDYYVEKEYEPVARQIFGLTPEMMEFFSKRLNYDYPWQKYDQIVGRDYVSGAMENTTAVLHMEAAQQKADQLVDQNSWEDTIAHELFHHWFGDLVTAESWSNLTVNESFANYSQYLWNEYKYGKDIADYTLMVERQGYLMDPANITKDLVRFNYHDREDMFDGVSYNKGGSILHMLRNYLGDDAFFAGLTQYLKSNEYSTGEAQQLRLALEKVSGRDLNWFFNQWYYGSGHPQLAYTQTYDAAKRAVTISVKQTQSQPFQFPLAIDVIENGKAVRHNVWADAKEQNIFVLPASAAPTAIVLNADGVLLNQTEDAWTPAQALAVYTTAKSFDPKYRALNAAVKAKDDASSVKLLQTALQDTNFRIRMKALKEMDLAQAANKSVITQVERLAASDPKTLVQASAITALRKTGDKKYSALYDKAMNSNSAAVKAAGLEGVIEANPERAVTLLDKIDLENAGDAAMKNLLPLVVQKKVNSQMPAIASTVAFYPFLKFQDPALGTAAEEGFNWIMSSDNTKAVEKLTRILGQARSQVGSNPQAKMMIVQMLQSGIEKKAAAARTEPNNPALKAQLEMLSKTMEDYKK